MQSSHADINKVLIIDIEDEFACVCKLNNGRIEDILVSKNDVENLTGNIYKGKVIKIMEGLQCAFIEFSEKHREGFLNIDDSLVDRHQIMKFLPTQFQKKVGDYIMVQATKEEIGQKGARLSTNISISGKYVVYLPFIKVVDISNKIEEEKRQPIFDKLQQLSMEFSGGFIARTQSMYVDEACLEEEAIRLIELFSSIRKNFVEFNDNIGELYNNNDIVSRAFNEIDLEDVSRIYCNNVESEFRINKLKKMYNLKIPISCFQEDFDMLGAFNLFGQFDELLANKVKLKNGASIVIEPTEALVCIDVNTGGYLGKSNRETTVFETNLLACDEIARQLKLRNVGGIIVIDFIDMLKEENKEAVLKRLKYALSFDKRHTRVSEFSKFGLVEMQRRRAHFSLNSLLIEKNDNDHLCFIPKYTIRKIISQVKEYLYKNDYKNLFIYCHKKVFENIQPFDFVVKNINIYAIIDNKLFINDFLIKGDNSTIISLPDNAKFLH